ncbi:MAG: hypothetical protein VB099_01500 [Candidatus Limiplasma sp.]|nr:hypothetical protein [Candidatus Limiplasma sp.]
MRQRGMMQASTLPDDALVRGWEMGPGMLAWFQFLYRHYDGFVLLLCGSAGTRHANFQHYFVESMTTKTYEYFLEARRRGLTQADISPEEMHILLSAFWTTVYEPFIHGYTWGQIQTHSALVCKLFDWYEVLGFATAP